jgi:hypothetical protein
MIENDDIARHRRAIDEFLCLAVQALLSLGDFDPANDEPRIPRNLLPLLL